MIPDAAIEAAARVMYPRCWKLDPPGALDLRARPYALVAARAALEAAMPAIREAIAQEVEPDPALTRGGYLDGMRHAARIVRGGTR